MTPGARTLILGIGNLLAGDDGIGVLVAQRLAADPEALPSGTRVIDGGACGLSLLPYLDGADRLIAVDAAELGAGPGTVRILRDGALAATIGAHHLSTHQAGLADLLGAAKLSGCLPGSVSLVGVQPGRIVDMTLELSAPVAAVLISCCQAVVDEAWADAPRRKEA